MKITKIGPSVIACLCGFAAVLILTQGCSTSTPAAGASGSTSSTAMANSTAGPSGKSGAQLWAENCIRCHNIRSPSSYSDAQWDVALLHMRVRANLTAEEHHKILAFMKTAH